ncbi:hypothetical protein BDR22DRAFT_237313 [Usnea florida]
MHPLKPLLLAAIGAAATATEDACGPVSTIFVTLPASPTTETIYSLSQGSLATADIEASVNGATQVTPTAVTATVIASVISTQVISIIQASSPAEGQADYSFFENNGTTSWLGATPPASASLITSTQVVTLQPVPPGYIAPPSEILPSATSFLTLSSTETVTETHTETQTLAIPTISASAGAYTGFASKGWNTSMSAFITVKSSTIVSVTVAEKLAYLSSTAYPVVSSGVVPLPTGNATRYVKARAAANMVVASIDGVAVSWTNNYDGTPPLAFSTPSVVAPVTATALQSEPVSPSISSTMSALVQTVSTPPTALNRTTYPYDQLPTLSPTSVSSLSAAQLTSSAATTTASLCGDASADFVIDFDDLPAFSAGPGDTDIPPIFNPYHKLFFQEYFGYVPPPSDPFPPISPPQLAVYRANDSGATASPGAGLELTGEIGSGPRASNSAYWIDAYSAYLGCTNSGPNDCSITVKGYQNSSAFSYITQGFTQSPCPEMKNCSLALVELADGFRNLTGLQIIATVGGTPVDWYMDNLSLGWSNNTCAAQLERSSQE